MSTFDAVIRYDTGDHHVTYAPDDALQSRVVFNNLVHLSEQSSQILVCSPHPETLTPTSLVGSTLRRDVTHGPFRFRVRPDGTSYRVRTRVNMRLTSDDEVITAYLALHPEGVPPTRYFSTGQPNGDSVSVTSTSAAWFEFGDDGVLWMPADQVAEAMQRRATLDDIGGSESSVVQPEAYLSLFFPSSSSVTVEVRTMYAAEFIGVD